MRKIGLFLLLATFLGMGLVGCYKEAVQESPAPASTSEPQGEWVPVKIISKGGGAPPPTAANDAQARLLAERAAKLDALRNLLEQTKGVVIKSDTTVNDYITKSDTIRAKVEGYLKNAEVVSTKTLNDGGVEVEMEIVLGQEFRRFFP